MLALTEDEGFLKNRGPRGLARRAHFLNKASPPCQSGTPYGPLYMQDASADLLRIGLLTDVHWAVDPPAGARWHNPYDFAGTERRLESAFAHFRREGVDLVAVSGDLSHHGDLASLVAVLSAFGAATPAALVVVAGNHDIADPRVMDRALAQVDARRVSRLGSSGRVHPELTVAGVEPGGSAWFGCWLGTAPSVPALGEDIAILVSHFPLLSRASVLADRGFPYPGDLLGRERIVHGLTSRTAPAIVLSGHIHARDSWADGPLLQLCQGAVIEPPYDCAVVEVGREAAGAIVVRRRSHRLAESHVRMEPVFTPEHETWRFDGAGWNGSLTAPPCGSDEEEA